MKKRKRQVSHDVYVDTRFINFETFEYMPFQTFRPRLIDVLNSIEDLPASKGLYACFNPGYDRDLNRIKKEINAISGIDVLWCREPKKRVFPGTYNSFGIGVIVRFAHNRSALELFDSLEKEGLPNSSEIPSRLATSAARQAVLWIDYAIIDNGVIKGVLEAYKEYEIPDFTSHESLMRASDYFIYAIKDNEYSLGRGIGYDYYGIIAYGAAAPAALRQLVNTWGIPSSYQQPGRP